MGKHHTMVEYYSGTKSSHLLVTMHTHTKASEHPELHTLHHGSTITRFTHWKLGAVFPLFTMGKKGSNMGRREKTLLLLLCFACFFLFFFFSLPASFHAILSFSYLSFSLLFIGIRLVWFQCQNYQKIHRSFSKTCLSFVLGKLKLELNFVATFLAVLNNSHSSNLYITHFCVLYKEHFRHSMELSYYLRKEVLTLAQHAFLICKH